MHPSYYYFGAPDSDSVDDTYDPTRECFHIDGLSASDSEDEAPVEGTRHLMSSSLPSGMMLNSLQIKECSSSKSTSYRIGLTRNEKTCIYYNEPSSKSVWHTHMVEELEKELAASIIASSRIGRSTPWFLVEPARTWLSPPCSFVTS
jgi:hypothetical protein